MGKRTSHTNKLKEFLSASALPEAEARKLYWKQYKAAWRKTRRKEQKEFTISYTPKELKIITCFAETHHRSTTRFIKEASLAYCAKQFLIPDPESVNQIKEILSLAYTRIENLTEGEALGTNTGEKLLDLIVKLETTVIDLLTKSGNK